MASLARRTAPIWAVLVLLAADSTKPAPQAAGPGRVEGTVALASDSGARTADRYTAASGETRTAQMVPAVVYLDGAVSGAPAARASGPLDLEQRGQAFVPTLLVVPVGTAVRFPNGDPVFHNVFSYSKARRFDLGRYHQGESKTVVFDKPGYVKVMCEVHKWMRSAVFVAENPYYGVADAQGRFHIDAVPPGHYRLVAEQFERRVVREIDVADGQVTRLDIRP